MKNDVCEFYNDGKTYSCDLTYKDITFTGEAFCHPDDEDLKSERTGYFIAEMRANIQKLQWIRDWEILPILKSYKHVYDCISHAPEFNKDSYEAFCLRRHIDKLTKELAEIKETIKEERNYLRNYIAEKDHLYHKIRMGKSY